MLTRPGGNSLLIAPIIELKWEAKSSAESGVGEEVHEVWGRSRRYKWNGCPEVWESEWTNTMQHDWWLVSGTCSRVMMTNLKWVITTVCLTPVSSSCSDTGAEWVESRVHQGCASEDKAREWQDCREWPMARKRRALIQKRWTRPIRPILSFYLSPSPAFPGGKHERKENYQAGGLRNRSWKAVQWRGKVGCE